MPFPCEQTGCGIKAYPSRARKIDLRPGVQVSEIIIRANRAFQGFHVRLKLNQIARNKSRRQAQVAKSNLVIFICHLLVQLRIAGNLIAWEQANIHVMSHVIHYGSSVFEGVRCCGQPQGSAVFRLPEHMQRLLDSAKIYRMEVPFTLEELFALAS